MHNFLRRCLPGLVSLALNALQGAANLAAAPESLLIGYWKFDEPSGDTATDSTGNGYTGTIVGAVRTAGQMGGALSFDGVNSYVFASDAQSGGATGVGLDMGTRDWTIAAWINTGSS